MPGSTVELVGRRAGLNGRERSYFVKQAGDEGDAISQALAVAPGSVDDFTLANVQAEEIEDEKYRVDVIYGKGDVPQPQGAEPETGGSSFHFEVSVQPVRIYLPPKGGEIRVYRDAAIFESNVPAVKVIGDTCDPEEPAEGAEIYEPHQEFSETHYVAAASVTEAYKVQLGELVGKLNDATFRARAAKTVLAMGVSGSLRSIYEDWEITYRFAFKPHQTALTVGSVTYDKKGWQHVWPIKHKVEQFGVVMQDVLFIAVADLYETADFSGFGIG
jgi:hypothetical protein